MKLSFRSVYKVIPILIINLAKIPFVSSDIKGWTPGPFSIIVNDSTEDVYIHELIHSLQFYRWGKLLLFWILYTFEPYRLKFECEAYAMQCKYLIQNGRTDLDNILNDFINALHDDYNLSYSDEELLISLTNAYNEIK